MISKTCLLAERSQEFKPTIGTEMPAQIFPHDSNQSVQERFNAESLFSRYRVLNPEYNFHIEILDKKTGWRLGIETAIPKRRF